MRFDYPIIKDWAFIKKDPTPQDFYCAPGLLLSRLSGAVSGHSEIEDGTYVATSVILRIIEEGDIAIVETKHSRYMIYKKDVSKKYEKEIRNVWSKLLININS